MILYLHVLKLKILGELHLFCEGRSSTNSNKIIIIRCKRKTFIYIFVIDSNVGILVDSGRDENIFFC